MMSAIIDGVIILLLAGSITYGYLVSRKVRLLMSTLKELEPLVMQFSTAVDKSQSSVAQMRENIAEAERPQAPAPQEAAPAVAEPQQSYRRTAFAARAQAAQARPGMRVMRDKQELVRAFFDSADGARA